MKDKIHRPVPNSLTFSGGCIHNVVRFRFRKAFPELPKCFAWLVTSTGKDLDWHDLPDSYLKKIGKRRSLTLVREVHDAQDLGLHTVHDFDNLLRELLGLNRAFLNDEGMTVPGVLVELYDELLMLAPPR